MGRIDYALFISLALYGAYVVGIAKTVRSDRRLLHVIGALLVAILLYTVLKGLLTSAGIQAR